jgi:3-hydroxyacyl-CoA dehydrogenase/3-hydroxy-2-methylbutyryl-CoA dehydrogenase
MPPVNRVVALVTGAAQGLGRATASRLVQHGARVVLVDLPKSGADAVAKELGPNATFAPADVTSEADVEAALDAARTAFGSEVTAAVNCAGVLLAARTLGRRGTHSLDDFLRVLRVNVGGTFNVCRLAAARMAALPLPEDGSGERGVIVNTASIAAFEGQAGQCAYAASKGAVAALTLPMARDLSSHGIRVVTLAPGTFETPMMKDVPPAAREALAAGVPFPKRLGRPDEFAALVQFAIEHPYLNGEVIRLDGALRLA